MGDKNATEVLRAGPAGIDRAAQILLGGGIVAVPTETVYGLAARADDAKAVAAIYTAKGRPNFNPLIVHVGSLAQARELAVFSAHAEEVARRMWPGPLTLVLPGRKDGPLTPAVTAGLDTVAIRWSAHPVMQALVEHCGVPLAAPSANRSETVSPTQPAHVLRTLDGRIDAILDAGPCETGVESTILAIRHDGTWAELRPGVVDCDALHQTVRGSPMPVAEPSRRVEAPGQLARHYAPGKPVRLNAVDARDGEYWIGFGAHDGDWNLSPASDLRLAATRLYDALHRAAISPRPRIAVAPIPDIGPGRAINDRLRRSAA